MRMGRKKLPKMVGHRRDHHEEYLDDPVERKHRVVLLGRHDLVPGDHVDPHEHADKHGHEEEGNDGKQIEQADAFMVGCKEPAEHSGVFTFIGEIGRVFVRGNRVFGHHRFPFVRRFLPEMTRYAMKIPRSEKITVALTRRTLKTYRWLLGS